MSLGRLLLVHLSDLHVRADNDPISQRAKLVANAARTLDDAVDAAIIVVSGDLAFSGSNPQYEAVWSFLKEIASELESDLSAARGGRTIPVGIYAIPGNHDCEFSESDELRKLAIEGILADPSRTLVSSIVNECLRVQKQFFDSLEINGTGGTGSSSTEFDRRLAYEYEIPVADSNFRLLCLNSAWLSQLTENPGRLLFPADAVPSRSQNDALVVAMFHHPYNWMEPNARRSFQKRIESVADLVLTGHEHEATQRMQVVDTGERNEYVEGGALQESHRKHESVFNAFVLDIKLGKQRFRRFAWDGTRYVSIGSPNSADEWSNLPIASKRAGGSFEMSESARAILDDLGAPLTHRDRGFLSLEDIFVFPDLVEVTYSPEKTGRHVPGPDAMSHISERPRLLILGDANSGKTCLARTLFRFLHRSGYVPILIDANPKMPRVDRIRAYLEKTFEEQYNPQMKEAFRQLDRGRRVVIVDDFHLLNSSTEYRQSFVEALTQFFGKVVLLADDLTIEASTLYDPQSRAYGDSPFETYRILPFGHVRRNALVEKWLQLGDTSNLTKEQFAFDREALTSTINAIMGRNLLPPYPVYVLAILQGSDALTPWDSSVSTYGAYYELLIRSALSRGRPPAQSDIVLNYLAFFAHELFRNKCRHAEPRRYREIHRAFEAIFDIEVPLRKMREDMTKRHIFAVSNDITQFKYKYIYYYFVARWLRDHIAAAETKATIKDLSRTLHIEEHANILLFLAHLSKDPFIVDALLDAARGFYPGIVEATFTDDVDFLVQLRDQNGQLSYQDQDPDKTRQDVLASMDQQVMDPNSSKELDELEDGSLSPTEILDPVAKLNAATKTLQILGQLLRNFPGSLEGDTKLDIARECYSLGFRSLTSLYSVLRDSEGPMIQFATSTLREQQPKLTDRELEILARDLVGMAAEFLGLAIVSLISSSVGSSDLEQTYSRLEEKIDTPAVRLVNVSVALNQSLIFPEGEVRSLASAWAGRSFARTILSYLVLMRFHTFPVAVPTKQRVCAALGIKYTPLIDANPLRKLVSGS